MIAQFLFISILFVFTFQLSIPIVESRRKRKQAKSQSNPDWTSYNQLKQSSKQAEQRGDYNTACKLRKNADALWRKNGKQTDGGHDQYTASLCNH